MVIKEDVKVLLTELVLEKKNLEMVLNYLKESIGRQVIIIDYKGMLCTGSGVTAVRGPDERFLSLTYEMDRSRPFYDEDTRRFYYPVGSSEKDGFIIINDVDPEGYETWLESLEQASLAVRTYLAQIAATETIENLYNNNFLTDVLLHNVNVKELIKNNYSLLSLNLNNIYYVCILEPERTLNEREKQALLSYTKDWIASTGLDVICTVWDNKYLVYICPTHYDKKTLEVDYGWTRHLSNITKYFSDVRKKFNFPALMGIGNKYSLSELHRSYKEALFTIHLSKLTGKGNLIRHFTDLGIFALICTHEPADLKNFCDKYLGFIQDSDKNYNRELLDSLRCFFDANFDVKEAADRLHLHINTLRYRLRKIEELSGMSLQQIEDRANLFVALKIYELLQSTEYIR